MKTKILLALALFSFSQMAQAITLQPVVGTIEAVKITPANPVAPRVHLDFYRVTDRGDNVKYSTFGNIYKSGNASPTFDNGVINVTASARINAYESEAIGGMGVRVASTKSSYINGACPQTMPFQVLRSRIESYYSGTAALTASDATYCFFEGMMDGDDFADLHATLSEANYRKAFLLVGQNNWNDNVKVAVALELTRTGMDMDVVFDDEDHYNELYRDNLDTFETIMWEHPAKMNTTFSMMGSAERPQ